MTRAEAAPLRLDWTDPRAGTHAEREAQKCTFRGCPQPPIRALRQSTGGATWLGCADHYPAMESALSVGLPGGMSGGAFVTVVVFP